jgi:serine-type D-Ala-D-Ala carboxypeptidase (penicillin-binding protein 5/6)
MKSDLRRTLAAIGVLAAICAVAGPAALAGPVAALAASSAVPKDQVGGPLLAGTGIVVHYPAKPGWKLPKIPASAYVIANARTGAVLAAKDAHGRYPPASTLKVLTAITMLPRLKPGALVKVSKLATSVVPNVVGLQRGRKYRVADLFRALLLISANDAAVALTQASGSFAAGMALINAEAHHLQAYDVVAKQPNGLPAAGQVVSAYDLALIARQALSMPAFLKYDQTLSARFPINSKKKVTLVNQNYLLTQYKGGIGGKIGWTSKAEATYIGLARRHGVTLIVTILHCRPLAEITSAEKLLNWGFAMNRQVSPVGTLVPPLPATAGPAKPGPAKQGPAKQGPTAGPLPTVAGAGNSLAGASGNSGDSDLALTAAIAAVLCIGLVGFAFLRRRQLSGGQEAHPVPDLGHGTGGDLTGAGGADRE